MVISSIAPRRTIRALFLGFSLLALFGSSAAGGELSVDTHRTVLGALSLDLSGLWTLKLDADDVGLGARWFDAPLEGGVPMALPGTTDRAGHGVRVDRETMTYEGIDLGTPFSDFGQRPGQRLDELGRLVREFYFVGPAWYERTVEIPAGWAGKSVQLELERVIWESRVWIDGRAVGSNDSLVAPHRHELGGLTPGVHRITLRIDNRAIHPTGIIQHGYGEETQIRWNGVVGALRLVATDSIRIEGLNVYPGANRREVVVRGRLGIPADSSPSCRVSFVVQEELSGRVIGSSRVTSGPEFDVTVPLGEVASAWDEFDPALYRLTVTVESTLAGRKTSHTVEESLGFRTVERKGADLLINGRRVFLRGVLDCAVYPLTGHPPMSLEEWLEVLGTIKSYGFNHVRYHTWCPPEAAFEAADRLGLYLAPEIAFWPPGGANGAPQLGQDEEVLEWVREEIRWVSETYGNHPSFCFFCIGNEFAPGTDWDVVDQVLAEAKELDPRRLYNGSTARTRVPADDFWVTHRSDKGSTRGIGPPHTDWDFAAAASDLPVISHETGQRPAFPVYTDLLPAFTGNLKPYDLELYRRLAEESGILEWERELARASALFALDQYKAEHEAMLRTPGWDGYQLLQLNDFTGQGEALVGLLDPFWRPKPGITVEGVREWNSPTVPLARFGSYVYSSEKELTVELEVAHYGPTDLEGVRASWELIADNGSVHHRGYVVPPVLKTGEVTAVKTITLRLPISPVATGAELRFKVGDAQNSWRLWFYPAASPIDEHSIHVTRSYDAAARKVLSEGGSVLFLAQGLFNENTEATGYASVYWSAKMFAWAGNNSLGVWPTPGHPALKGFPHDGHSDWHWHELTASSTAFRFESLPEDLKPIIQAIPDFHHAKPLLHVFEAKVGEGRLLVCGYDLSSELAARPVARQLRACLLRYMQSNSFEPSWTLPLEEARELFAGWEKHPRQDEWKIASCDSQETGGDDGRARNAIDGDPRTIWHTEWASRAPKHPHHLTIDLGREETVTGLRYLPRQGSSNGRVARYQVFASADGEAWQLAVEGSFENDERPRTARFETALRARYLKFVALSEVAGNAWASAAELSPVLAD